MSLRSTLNRAGGTMQQTEGSGPLSIMKAYKDTNFRLFELVDAYSKVYAPPGTDLYALRSLMFISVLQNPKEAEYLISRTDAPEFESYVTEFSCCDGVADFILIGPEPLRLPPNFHVTSVEKYDDGDFLTIGKRMP